MMRYNFAPEIFSLYCFTIIILLLAQQTKIEYMISLIQNNLYGVFHCTYFCKQLHFYGTVWITAYFIVPVTNHD